MQTAPIRADRRLLTFLIVLAALVRFAVSVPRLAGPPDDPDNYLPLACSLAQGDGFQFNGRPTAYRPPLYPVLLAPFTRLGKGWELTLAVVGINGLLGAGTVALSALAARRLGMAPAQVILVAAIVALDPILVVQARSVMTESLAAFLVALFLALLAGSGRFAAGWAGCALGLAGLCRPSLLAGGVLVVGAAALVGPDGWCVRLRRAGLIALGCVLVLAPWAYRNFRVWGEPIWTTTHGGYTLYLANNPVYYHDVLDGPPGAVWTGENQRHWFEAVNRAVAGFPAPQADRAFARSAWTFIGEHPWDFMRASVARLGRFWGVAPSAAVYPGPLRWVTLCWTVPFWVALGLGLLYRATWRWPAVAAPMIMFGLTLVHTIYWTDMRMRAPIIPALALIAAQLTLDLATRSRNWDR